MERYKELRRTEKRVYKVKKREYNDKIFEELKSLHSQHEVKKFYQNINNGRKEFKPRNMIRDSEGNIPNNTYSSVS